MEAEAFHNHKEAEEQHRVHRAVFQVEIFFDPVNVADGQLADDQRAQSVAEQDQRHGEREGECAQYAVDREGGVDDFEVENFTPV